MNTRIKYIIWALFVVSLVFGASNNRIKELSYHKKSNGTLIRLRFTKLVSLEDITGWISTSNWFYLTLSDVAVNVENVRKINIEPPVLEIEAIQNPESSQIGFFLEDSVSSFKIYHSKTHPVILVQLRNKMDGETIDRIQEAAGSIASEIITIPKNEFRGKAFEESFWDARSKYGSDQYFVWYGDWYSTNAVPGSKKGNAKVEPPTQKQKKKSKPKNHVKSAEPKSQKKTSNYSEKRVVTKKTTGIEGTEFLPRFPKPIKQDPSEESKIKIVCNLDGITVTVDGKIIGETPIKKGIIIEPGFHKIELNVPENLISDMYSIQVPHEKEVYIPGGKTQKLVFTLPEKPDKEKSSSK
ncbi:MAG: hypothetical protein ISR83_06265 [Candidatus Marinimicrobia bacterium]|nr:hypothetical protein [Candidatus Neomarinimicrobiota bacterium]